MEPSTPHMDRPHSLSGRKRRASPALACALIVSAVSFLSQSGTVAAADVNAQAADVSHPIFRVIVTRHGVRSPTKFPGGSTRGRSGILSLMHSSQSTDTS